MRQALLVVVMMGPCEGFMEWLSWGVAKQDLCESPCRCPEDVVLASQRGIDCVGCNLTYISGEREKREGQWQASYPP